MGDAEVPAVVDPTRWTAHNAREAAWAIQHALQAAVVFALRLVKVSANADRAYRGRRQ